MKKLFSRLLGGLSMSWGQKPQTAAAAAPIPVLSDTTRSPQTDIAEAIAAYKEPGSKSQRQFVHYVGNFDGMNIEINDQPIKPDQIKHYKGTQLTSEKFAVEVGDTTYVFWNNPGKAQKEIQLGMKNPATDLGDMRGQSMSIHHIESPAFAAGFDDNLALTAALHKRWKPETGTPPAAANQGRENPFPHARPLLAPYA